MIQIKHGNIFEEFENSSKTILCHGANCMNLMRSGIAKIISQNYPDALEVDTQWYTNQAPYKGSRTHYGRAGELSHTLPNQHKNQNIICNLYTQTFPGPNFKYEFLQQALNNLLGVIEKYQYKKVLFPAIGCGIGAGNFYVVVGIITKWYRENFIDLNKELEIQIYFPH